MLAPAIIACKRPGCSQTFHRKRLGQSYCSKRCRDADAQARKRTQRSADALERPIRIPRSADTKPQPPSPAAVAAPKRETPPPVREFTAGPTPGALQGDDYPLEYYKDGYPKLPGCLDRRANMKPS